MRKPPLTITSTANEKIKRLRALATKKHRDAEGVFIVEGIEPVQKALANGWHIKSLLFTADVKNTPSVQEIIDSRATQNAALYEVNDKVASYVTNRDNAQAVIGIFAQQYHDIESIKPTANGLWLGLENIRDPGNLGTIIRTADAAGVQGILLIGNTCDAFSPEVIRATTGSFSAVPLIRASLSEFLAWRKGFAGTVIGTHLHEKSINYQELTAPPSTLILMGSEQNGLSSDITDSCDILVKIPMRDGVESLNLAVSTGIILYKLAPSS